MTDLDLKSDGGLREACAEAERALDPNRVSQVAKFLAEVAPVPPEDRGSPEFQRRIWTKNPIRETKHYVGEPALSDSGLREWFATRSNTVLPTDLRERNEVLWDIYWEVLNRPGFFRNGQRPRAQTLRTLAALFPEHLTGALRSEVLQQLGVRMGRPSSEGGFRAEIEHECREQLMNSCWTRSRLDEVLGAPKDMEAHARRLLLSGELVDMVSPPKRNVWLFRAGKGGEDEKAWLERGLAFIGFTDVGDLSQAFDHETVGVRVAADVPDFSEAQITNRTSQLRQFVVEPRFDDWVVMPRKHRPTVAIGRIAGHYSYREIDGRLRHTRQVLWERKELPKNRLGAGLTKSLKFLGTVCWLGADTAAREVEAALKDHPLLVPLPAAQRRKGLTAVRGLFDRMLALVDFAGEHPAYEDILEYIRTEDPDKKEASIKAQFHRVASEFDTMRRIGDQVQLTERGRQLFESRDPDALRDHLLTKVLGIDHALVKLAAGPVDGGALFTFLQGVNPGWTTAFVPMAEVRWLVSLGVVQRQDRTYLISASRWINPMDWTCTFCGNLS